MITNDRGEKFITFDEAPVETLRMLIRNWDEIQTKDQIVSWANGKPEHMYLNKHYYPEQIDPAEEFMSREDYLYSLLVMAREERPYRDREELVTRAVEYAGTVRPKVTYDEMNKVFTLEQEDAWAETQKGTG